jgi:hypothetical protein
MIKKIIFPLAITLSLTTHAVCMDKEDDISPDKSTILAKLAKLNEEHAKEVQQNAELTNKCGSPNTPTHFDSSGHGVSISRGVDSEYTFLPEDGLKSIEDNPLTQLRQSNKRLDEMWVERQQLEALLKKAEEQTL